ncbi:YopX family protein [Enterococcus dispar]|uniref:YopX family protein n=1 Tax=Enterococcus dispar TaxID=44009 RepID=UPI00232E081E|nr:YopX family protein [Enterococcus dispar]WCG32982.1 YopX family protein [Enterococcus dispar]
MVPKFRAWDKNNKEMISWRHLLNGHNLRNVFMRTEMCGLELMQSTGLKDKNGVEIFEGDILKCTSGIYTNLGATGTGEYEETIKQVIWKDDSWGTRVISSNLTSKGAEKSGLVISAKYAEVVGNIYEQPELQAND